MFIFEDLADSDTNEYKGRIVQCHAVILYHDTVDGRNDAPVDR